MRRLIIIGIMMTLLLSQSVYGKEGDMGHMGGISEGSNLPKTIERYVTIPTNKTRMYQYKEVVFLSGVPTEFNGTITINNDDSVTKTKTEGSYKETYTVTATSGDGEGELDRTLTFTTYYKVNNNMDFKNQIITNSVLTGWEEEVTLGDTTYTLDEVGSSFSKAGVKDLTPGVAYFSTSISYVAKFLDGDGNPVTLTSNGSNYGYDQPWSKIETQERNIGISKGEGNTGNMQVRVQTVHEAKKTIYYDATEPFAISFGGTYNQRMESESNCNLDFLQGHWAEADFKKLYSMEVFTEVPHSGMQYEAISRGAYIKALCLAMNIDISKYTTRPKTVIFGDVPVSHPYYPYIMAAYDQKLIKGTGENFDVDRPINREEAFVVYVRVIGLERLGVTESPMTPFVDDATISSWAKKEIMAGYKLGIIKGDELGRVKPKQWISKSEAAAIINRLIDYLRSDIGEDYRK
ncbi:MAG: hypothetical protein CVV00_06120 [Firmicutes bacterium HGW-Firmicutes-5]|nr:MAG: hypothetical protein CVV00_06120 [Firmicutes bacterium HGW-Firmicutes-5]